MLRGAAALSAAMVLASCTSVQQKVGSWFGGATPTPTTAAPATSRAQVYYAGVEGLKVYSEASSSSKVVGVLPLHEKVTRTKLERGYAYVQSGDVQGWVVNARLIWRLPGAPTGDASAPAEAPSEEPAAPAAEPQAPEAPEATATASESLPTQTPLPTEPPTPKPTSSGTSPSIFDAY